MNRDMENSINNKEFALVNRLNNKITKIDTKRAVILAGRREQSRVRKEFDVNYHGAVIDLRRLPEGKMFKGYELTPAQLKKAHIETGEDWGVWF